MAQERLRCNACGIKIEKCDSCGEKFESSDDIYCVLVVADGFKHYCENCVEKAKAEAIYEVD